MSVKVLQLGLGAIGRSISKLLADRAELTILGAIDPAYAGESLAALAGLQAATDVTVAGSLGEFSGAADVAILTTTSRMEDITPQVLALIKRGLPVVSTCEELVYPWATYGELAEQIDRAAKAAGVAVLSTGVNPGFLMDFLPIIISRMVGYVASVTVERIQDAHPRREAFQRKIGAGLTVDQFEAKVAIGNFGHAGLTASVHLLAAGLGWDLDGVEETIVPVLAKEKVTTEFLSIAAGDVAGVHQEGIGSRDGREVVRLIFQASVGEPESYDRIRLDGDAPLTVLFPDGVPGDTATGSITVNAVPLVMNMPPGFRTMADLWTGPGDNLRPEKQS